MHLHIKPDKYFENQVPLNNIVSLNSSKLNDKIIKMNEIFIKKIISHVDEETDVYTGIAGKIYMLLHFYFTNQRDEKYLTMIRPLALRLQKDLDMFQVGDFIDDRYITFLTGIVGELCIMAIYFDIIDKHVVRDKYITHLISIGDYARKVESCELMYGRTGYLYAINLINHYFDKNVIPSDIVNGIAKRVIETGRSGKKRGFDLCWAWHGKNYLGAAHGMSGIIYQLLQFDFIRQDEKIMNEIVSLVNQILQFQQEDGNYIDLRHDLVCQWCYGAPAMIPTLIRMYSLTNNTKYLDSAKKASEAIWKYGILTKGMSLCHGIAGNAYSFMKLYILTKDDKYYVMASYFASFCVQDQNIEELLMVPDHPFSLFEGIAGTCCFLNDFVHNNDEFPAYDIPITWKSKIQEIQK